MLNLFIKTLDNVDHSFCVGDETSIGHLKQEIRKKLGISIENQRLIFRGRVLDDECLLSDLDVNGKVMHLVTGSPPSLQPRTSSQTSRDEHDPVEVTQRNRINQPRHSRTHTLPLNSPSRLVLDMDQELSLSPVARRLHFIQRMLQDIRAALDTLSHLGAGSLNDSPRSINEPESAAGGQINASEQPAIRQQEISLIDGSGHGSTEPAAENRPPQPSVSRPPRQILTLPRDFASLMEELDTVWEQFAPYRAVYVAMLRDNTLQGIESPVELARIRAAAEACSNVMHSIAHAYHAASDIQLTVGGVKRLTTGFCANRHQLPVQAHINLVSPRRVDYTGQNASGAAAGPSFTRFRSQRINSGSLSSDTNPNSEDSNQQSNPANPHLRNVTYQVEVETRIPTALPIHPEFVADWAAAGARESSGRGQGGQQAQGQSQPQGQAQGQAQPQAQYGQDAATPQDARSRALVEIENLLRTLLSQAHPAVEVVMSMEEIHDPMMHATGAHDFNADMFGSRPTDGGATGTVPPTGTNNIPGAFTLFGLNNETTGAETPAPGAQANPNSGVNADAGPSNIQGVRFDSFLGPNARISGYSATLAMVPDNSAMVGLGPAAFTLQPDGGGVFVSPMGENNNSASAVNDAFQNMFATMFRQASTSNNNVNTGNVATTNTTGASASSGAMASASSGTTASASSGTTASTTALNSVYATPLNTVYATPLRSVYATPSGAILNNAVPSHSAQHNAIRITTEAPRIIVSEPMQEVPHEVNVDNSRQQRAGDSRRRTAAEAGLGSERIRVHQTHTRAHQLAVASMTYDEILSCDSEHARRHLDERRRMYRELYDQQLRLNAARRSPPAIYRLEERNHYFTTRHMGVMTRLLNGPVSSAARLNAFMVTVARVLFLNTSRRPRHHEPMCTPREFNLLRNHLREYMLRIIDNFGNGGESDLFDRIAVVIIGYNRPFYERMSQYAPIDPEIHPVSMLQQWLCSRLPYVFACVMQESTTDILVSRFYKVMNDFYTDLCAFVMQLCTNGFEGLRALHTAFIDEITQSFDVDNRDWLRLLSRENLIAVLSTIDPHSPNATRLDTHTAEEPVAMTTPLPVSARPIRETISQEATPSVSSLRAPEPPILRSPPPLAVQAAQVTTGRMPAAHRDRERRTASSMSTPARRVWDEQWLPVFSRDQRVQRELQRSLEPYSDAYVSGIPARKRRCLHADRPSSSFVGFANGTARSATGESNMETDVSVRRWLLDSMSSSVEARAQRSEDFNAARYPAAARLIERHRNTAEDSPERQSATSPERDPDEMMDDSSDF